MYYYCLKCKTRVSKEDVIMEPDMKGNYNYKHMLYYLQSGKKDYVLHPARKVFEKEIKCQSNSQNFQ